MNLPQRSYYNFKGCVSEVFEPYLRTYSENEERKINETIEGIVGANDKLEVIEYAIYSSSLRLFKSIKDSLRRCTSFSTSKALFDLHTSFKNVFRHYRQLLKRTIPSRSYDINYETIKYGLPGSTESIKELPEKAMAEAVEMKCVYIINTCEYILDVVPQLQNSIEDKIDQEYIDKIDLSIFAGDLFRELMRASLNCLVVSLCARNDTIYAKTLLKRDWLGFQMTGAVESLPYMTEVAKEMNNRVARIKKELNPVYFNLLMNKLVIALPSNFLLNVYKIKKGVSAESSQQFLFDIQNELRNLLLSLPNVELNELDQVILDSNKSLTDSYKLFVDKNLSKVMARCKVLGYPGDKDIIAEGY